MKRICIAAMALLFHSCQQKITVQTPQASQPTYTDPAGSPMLLGIHKKEDLQQAPYKEWFDKNYAAYTIDSAVTAQLKPLLQHKKFEIFMGTWCGDSKREVPRMFKLLEYAGVQPSQITMIMVDDHDSTYKQSPSHEERGKSIHRVPDLIVYEGKKEMNRIVEYPVISLEQDLVAIAKGELYQPNYKGAAYLLQLTKEKSTALIMNDSTHTSGILKGLVKNSAELNSLGHVWKAAGEKEKAMLAFQLNAMIFAK